MGDADSWRCPACGGTPHEPRFRTRATSAAAVHAESVVPSSDRFGLTAGPVNRCRACGHAALAEAPEREVFEGAYAESADEVSLDEEQGQVATADRDLERIERWAPPGALLDVGSWTGSFLVAARQRGWQPEGIEPSSWACERARARGCQVQHTTLEEAELPAARYRAIVATDVIEHLLDPGAAVTRLRAALEDGGILFLATPDAGSPLARLLGRRWWSVLPMHVQYFTRGSITTLLARSGFVVEDISTHAKAFSVGYYADRLAAFTPIGRNLAPAVTRGLGHSNRIVAPDLSDRMAVIARKVAAAEPSAGPGNAEDGA